MRNTVAIEKDVFVAAEEIARKQNRSIDDVVSELARRSLKISAPWEIRNGIPVLPKRANGVPVTPEIVNALRDEEP
ncbi:CopG family transcriptional regulator [Metarhizobium album]|uniref:CopG family transcriptional regulator n=1 Tax=Metarhizobium album TaxID=2182425 RepID=A0A2U2DUD1_9HYPH|nr:CopG family transcriptional regulator [Rhizobium album]PWE56829.1 CopG family transcriptional regulator [Rhizobium album]